MAERASPRGAAKQGGQAKPWDGRTPISVAAGLILLVAVLPKVPLNPAACPALLRLTGCSDVYCSSRSSGGSGSGGAAVQHCREDVAAVGTSEWTPCSQ